ncbi:MAG: chemotaxis protein CheB [Bacteroidota bacterium]
MEKKYIVALGSSAGGLKPMLTFFDNTPNDHATYIILRHLQVNARSLLGYILKRHSKLSIVEVENGMLIEENKIYTQPPGSYITIRNGYLYLHPSTKYSMYPNKSIDIFLKSLAETTTSESIVIILSGRGSDGAKGVGLIKEKGGLILVQKPQSCEYPSMPESSIKTGAVDLELLPDEMPGAILKQIYFRLQQKLL